MLVYNPSKDSGFGHAGRPRSLIKLIPQVSRFLEQFTFHSEAQDVSIQVFRATDYDLEDHSERYVKEVTSCFGPCSNDGDFFLSRLGDAPKPMNYRWELQGDLLGKATDFLLSGPPYPKQLFGPVRLSYFFNFEWKDPRSGLPFAGDLNAKSNMRIDLQRDSFIAPELQFPFSLSDERLYEMLKLIVPALPFKLGVKHFRLRVPLKDGKGYKLVRLAPSESARISECI